MISVDVGITEGVMTELSAAGSVDSGGSREAVVVFRAIEVRGTADDTTRGESDGQTASGKLALDELVRAFTVTWYVAAATTVSPVLLVSLVTVGRQHE